MHNIYLQAVEKNEDFGERLWEAVLVFPLNAPIGVMTFAEFKSQFPSATLFGVPTDYRTVQSYVERTGRNVRDFYYPVPS